MRRKGFTLIELLAVIVILTIIALIAMPMVLNTIDKVKRGAFEQSSNSIIKAAELYQARQYLNNPINECRYFSFDNDVAEITEKNDKSYYPVKELEIKGTLPSEGEIKICKEQITMTISDGKYTARYDEKKLVVTDGNQTTPPTIEIKDVTSTQDSIIVPYTIETNGIAIKDVVCEYGTDANYGYIGSINNNQCELTNLTKDTTYYYKITAINEMEISSEPVVSWYRTRGDNLIFNGDLSFKNNTNFSKLTYNTDETGGFLNYTSDIRYALVSDEIIPVDIDKNYTLSMNLKSSNDLATYYVGFQEFDVDYKPILSSYVMYIPGSTTTLAKDLKKGDTVVYLNDLSGFQITDSTASVKRGFIFWDYVDSTGYMYPEHTYSRHVYTGIYEISGFDYENNTITLSKAWAYDSVAAGTKVSQSNSSAVFNYSIISNTTIPTTWNAYSTTISGVSSSNISFQKFRPGTKYIKLYVDINVNNVSDTTFYMKNISFKQT